MKPDQPTSAGFTLLELVTVLLLLAILAVTVSSRWTGTADLQVQQERDQLLALLRRVQAGGEQAAVGIQIGQFQLRRYTEFTDISLPAFKVGVHA